MSGWRFLALTVAVCSMFAVSAGPAGATFKVTPHIYGSGSVTDSGIPYSCVSSNPGNTQVLNCATENGFPCPVGTSLCFFQTNLTAVPKQDGHWRFVGWSNANDWGCGTDPVCGFADFKGSTVLADPVAVFHEIVNVALTSKPPLLSNSRSATFGYSSSNQGAFFQCAVDGSSTPCGSASATVDGLADGAHTFQVTAVSQNGNPSEPPASYTWTVDTISPVASFTSGPLQGALQTVNFASFEFTSSEPTGATFECSLDNATFAACTSPAAVSNLAPGLHSFRVRARDRAGNLGDPTERDWTVPAPDADGDGVNSLADCNDADPTIHPGAYDIPGNGVDENCDGADAPAVVEQIRVGLTFFYSAAKTSTRFTKLQIDNVPAGATVQVTCKGKGCPKGLRGRGFVRRNASGTVKLSKFIKRPLKANTTITVVVSKPGAIAAVKRLKVRSLKAPLVTTLCQPPGARSPEAC